MSIDEIRELFDHEFLAVKGKFMIFDLPLSKAPSEKDEFICCAGVYVFWHPNNVIKVGRHLKNSRMRALQHIQDNTAGLMRDLIHDSSVRLLLFNVIDPKNKHWVAALEIYFETTLGPEIRSKRS
jgi:hypothetical protein